MLDSVCKIKTELSNNISKSSIYGWMLTTEEHPHISTLFDFSGQMPNKVPSPPTPLKDIL